MVNWLAELSGLATAAVLLGGVLAAILRLEIRASLDRLKLDLLAELDNRYVLRREFEARIHDTRRVD